MYYSTLAPIVLILTFAAGAATWAASNDSSEIAHRRAIAHRLGWPFDKTYFGEEKLDGLLGCKIYGVIDTRVDDGVGLVVAILKDGSSIVSSEPQAMDQVFARCISPEAPARTLARLMTDFSRYSGLRVLEDDSLTVVDDLLKKAGRQFAAPGIVAAEGTKVVRFMALSGDGSTLYELKGRIGKPLAVEAQELAKTY